MQDTQTTYDLVIVGGGPAGLNAALYAKRKGLETVIVAGQFGGQMQNTGTVENYLGIETAEGWEISETFTKHVRALGVTMMEFVDVVAYTPLENGRHQIILSDGQILTGRTLIIATGSQSRKLEIPGESTYDGRGISYCAICDGPLYRGRRVIVAGGGNAAIEGAMDIARVASEVTVVQRSVLRADLLLQQQMAADGKVKVYLQTTIQEVLGDGEKITGIRVVDNVTGESRVMETDGLFIEIGIIPNLGPFAGHVAVNALGEIVIDPTNMTSVPGLFAAGDVTDVLYKQITVAASEGAAAALSVTRYLNQGKA